MSGQSRTTASEGVCACRCRRPGGTGDTRAIRRPGQGLANRGCPPLCQCHKTAMDSCAVFTRALKADEAV
eukprot:363810-Chlamydomonas_euryale.AAC.2